MQLKSVLNFLRTKESEFVSIVIGQSRQNESNLTTKLY